MRPWADAVPRERRFMTALIKIEFLAGLIIKVGAVKRYAVPYSKQSCSAIGPFFGLCKLSTPSLHPPISNAT